MVVVQGVDVIVMLMICMHVQPRMGADLDVLAMLLCSSLNFANPRKCTKEKVSLMVSMVVMSRQMSITIQGNKEVPVMSLQHQSRVQCKAVYESCSQPALMYARERGNQAPSPKVNTARY